MVRNKSLFFPLGHPDIDSSVFVDLQQLQLQLRQFQGIVIYSNSLLDNAPNMVVESIIQKRLEYITINFLRIKRKPHARNQTV